jgi:hypothetical protein
VAPPMSNAVLKTEQEKLIAKQIREQKQPTSGKQILKNEPKNNAIYDKFNKKGSK